MKVAWLLLMITLQCFPIAEASEGSSAVESESETTAEERDSDTSRSCKQAHCHWNADQPSNWNAVGLGWVGYGKSDVMVIAKDAVVQESPRPGWRKLGWLDVRDARDGDGIWRYLCQLPATNASEITAEGSEADSESGNGQTNTSMSSDWYTVYHAHGPIRQSDAAQKCQEQGGYLGTVTSEEDEAKVGLALNKLPSGEKGWVITGGHLVRRWTVDGAPYGTWAWKYGPPLVVEKTFWQGKCPDQGHSMIIIFCILGVLILVALLFFTIFKVIDSQCRDTPMDSSQPTMVRQDNDTSRGATGVTLDGGEHQVGNGLAGQQPQKPAGGDPETKTDDANNASSCCGGTECHAVKPHQPDPIIDYTGARNLEHCRWRLHFHDTEVQAEFRRFMMRDMAVLLFSVASAIVMPYWVLFALTDPNASGASGPIFIGMTIVSWTLTPIEIYCHFFQANTYRTATIRLRAQFAIGLLIIPLFYGFGSVSSFRGEVHNWTVMLNFSTFVFFQLPPLLLGVLYLLNLAAYVVVLVISSLGVESTATPFAVKVFVAVSLGSITFFLVVVARYRASMQSFKATVLVQRSMQTVAKQMDEVDLLMCAMVPSSALVRICNHETVADFEEEATVQFSDMVQFTRWSAQRTPVQLVSMLNAVCFKLDLVAQQCGVEKIKTIGDAYWAVCNIPNPVPDHVERMTEFGRKVLNALDRLNEDNPEWEDIAMRVGLETGPVYGGILGTRQLTYEVYGETSMMATMNEANGRAGKVAVSALMFSLLGLKPGIEGVEIITSSHPEKPEVPIVSYALLRESVEYHRAHLPQQAFAVTEVRALSRASSSQGSQQQVYSKEEAKKRRQVFVEERADQGTEGDEGLSMQDLELQLTQRKYNNFFYDFGADQVETKFKAWVEPRSRPLRMLCNLALLLSGLVLAASILMEDSTLPVTNWSILFVSLLLVGVSLLLALRAKLPLIQVILHHSSSILFLIAIRVGVHNGISITTNETYYLYSTFTTLLMVGNVGIVSAGALLLVNIGIVYPIALLILTDPIVLVSIFGLLQTLVMVFFVAMVLEKQYRREFADVEIASFLSEETEKRKHEQAVLLQAMVPQHVIPDLMKWLQTDMLPSDAPTKHFPKMCVAFLKFCGARISAQEEKAPAPRLESPAVVDFDDDGESEKGNEETCGGKTTSAAIQEGSPPQGMEHVFGWLSRAHNKMDEIIDQFPSIDKVKTIGETVMVAGPFQEKHSCVEAADQLLAAMTMMQQEAQVQVGLHVGEIVGSIVGNNRICFDIFGDAVNVASRAMSGGPAGKIRVTEEFYQEHTAGKGEHAHSQGTVFSDPETQAAKGKGFLTVRQVVSTCQDSQEDH